MAGSIIGLTILAHINDTWTVPDDPSETHPDFITRYEVAMGILKSMSKSIPIGPEGGHPFGFMVQLSGFVGLVIDRWLTRNLDGRPPANVLHLTSRLFEQEGRIRDELSQLQQS